MFWQETRPKKVVVINIKEDEVNEKNVSAGSRDVKKVTSESVGVETKHPLEKIDEREKKEAEERRGEEEEEKRRRKGGGKI